MELVTYVDLMRNCSKRCHSESKERFVVVNEILTLHGYKSVSTNDV